MILCENDKLTIPETYRKMSVSELKKEKEKLYFELKKGNKEKTRGVVNKQKNTIFKF